MTALAAKVDLDEQRLRSRLDAAWRQAQWQRRPVLTSVALPVPSVDHLSFFEQGARLASDRLFWTCPEGGLALTGVGAAWTLAPEGPGRFAEAAAAWREVCTGAVIDAPAGVLGTGPVLLGGFAFDPRRPATSRWAGYPDGLLVLPRYLLASSHGMTWLTVNTVLWPDSEPTAGVEAAVHASRTLLAGARVRGAAETGANGLTVEEVLPAAAWKATVRSLTSDMRQSDLEKVVLARECRVRGRSAFDPLPILRRLRATYPTCFVFAVARGDRCFLGATPEQLVRLRDGQVETACLAGSIARGATEAEDRWLGETLRASSKDRIEHAIVVRALCAALTEAGVDLAPVGEPALMKVRHIQHLRTRVLGANAGGLTILDVLEHLHPTPAVGGYPRATALRLIREREGLDRGWYAGPIGWLDARGEGEFAVAIRSALLHGSEAALFAGCGIVADSDPEREYAESCLKLRSVLSVLQEVPRDAG